MNRLSATGWQIAFLIFAGMLLVVPLTSFVEAIHPWTEDEKAAISKTLPFVIGFLIFIAFPRLRRWVRAELSKPVARNDRLEVAAVAAAKVLLFALAIGGAIAFWYWMFGGTAALERRMDMQLGDAAERSRAISIAGMAKFVILAAIVAPVFEELLFRGLLYRAWEARYGWIPSMLLTSAVFGLYHPFFFSAFAGSIIYVCLYRRTGTLWAPIAVHSISNLALWYPLLGQFVFPRGSASYTDMDAWTLHFVSLGLVVLLIPLYVWFARGPREPRALFSR